MTSETHVLLVAPTRSGKGVGHDYSDAPVLAGECAHSRPQGRRELRRDGPLARAGGREPDRVLYAVSHAAYLYQRAGHDPRWGSPAEVGDTQTIAQSLVAPEKMARESATSLHFRELAALMLTASMLHVKYTVPGASLARVWYFLTQQHPTLQACLKTLRTTAHHAAGVHQAIATLTTALSNITGDRELSSVWSTAIRPLVLYNDPLIARSTDTSTFALEDLQYGAAPLSLYLVAPSPRALDAAPSALPRGARCGDGAAHGAQGPHLAASAARSVPMSCRPMAISTRLTRARPTWPGTA